MKLLILGYARHGKDTVAEILRDEYGMDFRSSSFFVADRVVRPGLAARGITYDTLEECYEDRVNHRAAWRDLIAEFNEADPARLSKEILAECPVYVGMRTQREYDAAVDLFDAVIWVDALARHPAEGKDSMDIEPDPSTMYFIDNNRDLEHLRREVAAIASLLGIARV